MISSDFRAEARKKLEGKWGKAALIILAYAVISLVLSFIENLLQDQSFISAIVSIGIAIIEIPLGFGLIISLLKLFKGEDVKSFDFLQSGFSNFKKAWGVTLQTFLKMLLPIILMIVAYILMAIGIVGLASSAISGGSGALGIFTIIGVILLIASAIWMIPISYSYKLAYIIAADNENLTSKEAVEKSKELMNGNRWKLFCLEFSFIGWAILGCITLGIGYFWLIPYIQFAVIAFYMFLNGNNTNSTANVVEEPKNDDTDNGPIQ